MSLAGSGGGVLESEYWVQYAQARIFADTGNRVSVRDKLKSLTKFGRTLNADANVKTTVGQFQGLTVVNETFATGNTIDYLVSDNNSDAGNVTVEGHTVDGSGNRTFVVQTRALSGHTPAALATPLFRATRIYRTNGTYASPATDLAGNVYVYDSTLATGVTSGVPDVATATKVMIAAGEQQSHKCATSLSSADYWILTYASAGLIRSAGANASVDVDIEVRELGGVWRPLGLEISLSKTGTAFIRYEFKPYFIIPPNSDIRMVATSDTDNTTVQGSIGGVLGIVL